MTWAICNVFHFRICFCLCIPVSDIKDCFSDIMFLFSGPPWLKKKAPMSYREIHIDWIYLSLSLSLFSLQPSILTVLLNCNKKSLKSNGPMPLRSSGSSQRQPQMSSQADMLVPYQDSASKGPFTVLQWCQSHSSLVWIMELCLGTSPFP